MKIVIGLVVIIACLGGAYKIWEYWDKVSHDRDISEQEAAAKLNISGDSLQGMPQDLRKSFDIAKGNGPAAMGKWLNFYGAKVEDPRRAWIELDYVVSIAQDNPNEAKRIFADVKARTPETSPVYTRIKSLQKTFE
jgi:hypothetical protein